MEKQYDLFFGRLGRNPDLRYTPSQKAVCYLSIAVNKPGEERPDWKRVVVWGKQAELCSVQLKKGSELFVQGQNQEREFEDKEGNLRKINEVNARLVGFSNL